MEYTFLSSKVKFLIVQVGGSGRAIPHGGKNTGLTTFHTELSGRECMTWLLELAMDVAR